MRVKPVSAFLWALPGPVIWAVHFFSIYMAEALICAAPNSSGVTMRVTALVLTLAALALLFTLIVSRRQNLASIGTITETENAQFLPRLTLSLSLISMLAVIWVAVPVFVLPVCAFAPG